MVPDHGKPDHTDLSANAGCGMKSTAAIVGLALAFCGFSEWRDTRYAGHRPDRLAALASASASAGPAESPASEGGAEEDDDDVELDDDEDDGDDEDDEKDAEDEDDGDDELDEKDDDDEDEKDDDDEDDDDDDDEDDDDDDEDDDLDLEDLDDEDDDEGDFDRDAARAALKKSAKKAGRCRRRGESTGSTIVAVTFQPDGTATKLVMGNYRGTPTGKCIEKAMLATTIDQFEGEPKVVRRAVRVW